MKVPSQKLTLYTAIGIIVVVVGIIAYVQFSQQRTIAVSGQLDFSNQPALGSDNAPVKIAIFEDFRCPGCASFSEGPFVQLEREFVASGEAQIFFFNLPVLGEPSFTAALAARCVFEADAQGFWDYKRFVYRMHLSEGSESVVPNRLVSLANEAIPDLNAQELRQCIDERRFASEVQRESDVARSIGVSATPSIVVNGQLVSSPNYAAVRSAIEAALAQN